MHNILSSGSEKYHVVPSSLSLFVWFLSLSPLWYHQTRFFFYHILALAEKKVQYQFRLNSNCYFSKYWFAPCSWCLSIVTQTYIISTLLKKILFFSLSWMHYTGLKNKLLSSQFDFFPIQNKPQNLCSDISIVTLDVCVASCAEMTDCDLFNQTKLVLWCHTEENFYIKIKIKNSDETKDGMRWNAETNFMIQLRQNMWDELKIICYHHAVLTEYNKGISCGKIAD